MDKKRWTIAHDIAFDLVDQGTDPNELGKVVAFMRRHHGDNDAKNRLMSLVQRLANSRNALIRSRQTPAVLSEHPRSLSRTSPRHQ